MQFKLTRQNKTLIFDSELSGLEVAGKLYISGKDGKLIYDQVRGLSAEQVRVQMSTNTSTLIPALKILLLPYPKYFDQRPVAESQNNITFYWQPSKLAAYYNRFSTDDLDYSDRQPIIEKAVDFLIANHQKLPLKKAMLNKVSEPCKLLGFYQGFPIFDSSTGFAKLQSRLGIHIGSHTIMISTPMDKYQEDVYQLAEQITKHTRVKYTHKKNRAVFEKKVKILKLLNI